MRRASGFVPARACVTESLVTLLARQPLSPAKVAFAWQTVVGPALARVTEVRLDDGGLLAVRVTDPRWRLEIQRAEPLIVERLRGVLGASVISGLALR